MACRAWLGGAAMMSCLEVGAGRFRVIVAVADASGVDQLFLSVNAVQFHDLFAFSG